MKRRIISANDKEKKDKAAQGDAANGGAGIKHPALDGEDLDAMEEEASYPGAMNGKYRFD